VFDTRSDEPEHGHEHDERSEGDQQNGGGVEQSRLVGDDEVDQLEDVIVD